MKKLTALLMVLMLLVTGISPTFAVSPGTTATTDDAIMPLVDYEGPFTTYVEEIIIEYGICNGARVKFTDNKLTVSAGAVNNSAATVSSSYITVRINKYLPGGTYVTIASQTIPVDGESHAIVAGMDIDPDAVYMFSYSLTTGVGALVDVVTVGYSYSL